MSFSTRSPFSSLLISNLASSKTCNSCEGEVKSEHSARMAVIDYSNFSSQGVRSFMSNIGICEYVIGVIHDKNIWYYVGEYNRDGKKLKPREKYSSFLADAKRYDLNLLHESVTREIFEILRCQKCGKEFTEYPALSRVNNETEICPECGIAEAVEASQKAT